MNTQECAGGPLFFAPNRVWRCYTGGALLDEFIAQIGQTKEACDAMETAKGCSGSSSTYDTTLEHFTEAVRQARGFVPDLVMMREQRPS